MQLLKAVLATQGAAFDHFRISQTPALFGSMLAREGECRVYGCYARKMGVRLFELESVNQRRLTR